MDLSVEPNGEVLWSPTFHFDIQAELRMYIQEMIRYSPPVDVYLKIAFYLPYSEFILVQSGGGD